MLLQKGEGHIHTEKWHRCVEHVKARGKGANAYAVCTAQLGEGSINKEHRKKYAAALKFDEILSTLKFDDSKHPRNPGGMGDKSGEFVRSGSTGTGGTGTGKPLTGKERDLATDAALRKRKSKRITISDSLTPSQKAMQIALARQAQKPLHKVDTAEEAVELVLKGQNVEIKDTKHVHTLLKKLGEMAIAAKEAKKEAVNFDPCTITVKGVSLFCAEKIKTKEFPHGIPRIEMPQFKSKNPIPGSEADKLPRDDGGEVDATKMFLKHLEAAGVKSEVSTVENGGGILARKLKASQAEMEGAKVAGMMLNPKRNPKTAGIIVSRDGYVIDGHHTWAAAVGRDAEDGDLDNDLKMDVTIVDMPMSEIYHISKKWTLAYGLPAASVKKVEMVFKSEDAQIVYGEVYAPNRPDAQGEYMTAPEILKMAHAFLRSGRMGQIDLMHGNKVVKGASVVESFVANHDDSRFIPESWVIGVHIPDKGVWASIRKGEINGFSMEALVSRHDMEVDVEIPSVVTGLTSKQEDHQHKFFVSYDQQGQFKGGVTDTVNGHYHSIVAGTHTQDAAGHRHRFSSVDNVRIME